MMRAVMTKRIVALSVFLYGALLFAFGLGTSGNSWAQTAPPINAEEANQPADPTTLLQAAQKVILLIDQGLGSELWQHTSTVMHSVMTEEEFVRRVYAARRSLGVMLDRRWAMIMQVVRPGSADAPAGIYVTVSFITSFAGKSGLREEVTFRLRMVCGALRTTFCDLSFL